MLIFQLKKKNNTEMSEWIDFKIEQVMMFHRKHYFSMQRQTVRPIAFLTRQKSKNRIPIFLFKSTQIFSQALLQWKKKQRQQQCQQHGMAGERRGDCERTVSFVALSDFTLTRPGNGLWLKSSPIWSYFWTKINFFLAKYTSRINKPITS